MIDKKEGEIDLEYIDKVGGDLVSMSDEELEKFLDNNLKKDDNITKD